MKFAKLLLFVAVFCPTETSANPRPNIVLIMSDDHACRAIGAYDSPLIKTPNIDRIAKQGVRFDRCYVTNSICGPSRACILTGKYSHQNGYFRNGQDFDNQLITFPELLQQNGYQTAIVGKWHLGRTLPQGFDYWRILQGQGYYYQSKWVSPNGRSQHVGYTTDLITDYTLQWLQDHRTPDQPFLLMMHHKAPHRPWDPAPQHVSSLTDKTFPEPPTLFDDFKGRSTAAKQATMRISDHMAARSPDIKAWDDDQPSEAREWFYGKMTRNQWLTWRRAYDDKNQRFYDSELDGKELARWKYQRYLQDYLACVLSVDQSVGAILDYLESNDLSQNTVVIYCSDQGFFSRRTWLV